MSAAQYLSLLLILLAARLVGWPRLLLASCKTSPSHLNTLASTTLWLQVLHKFGTVLRCAQDQSGNLRVAIGSTNISPPLYYGPSQGLMKLICRLVEGSRHLSHLETSGCTADMFDIQ